MNRLFLIFTSLASLFVALLDGYFKSVALATFSTPTPTPTHFFAFGLHKNPGILFDIPIPQILIWIITPILLLVLARFAFLRRNTLIAHGTVLLFFGALGNLIDRIVNGFTTDYILLITRSAFNLSDMLILVGLVCIIFNEYRSTHASTVRNTQQSH